MQFDGTFLWTDDANATPPTSASPDDRRRRYIAGVRRYAIVFAVLLPFLA